VGEKVERSQNLIAQAGVLIQMEVIKGACRATKSRIYILWKGPKYNAKRRDGRPRK